MKNDGWEKKAELDSDEIFKSLRDAQSNYPQSLLLSFFAFF